jgi:hypothetical protein
MQTRRGHAQWAVLKRAGRIFDRFLCEYQDCAAGLFEKVPFIFHKFLYNGEYFPTLNALVMFVVVTYCIQCV